MYGNKVFPLFPYDAEVMKWKYLKYPGKML